MSQHASQNISARTSMQAYGENIKLTKKNKDQNLFPPREY
jgi:hypothetical protein